MTRCPICECLMPAELDVCSEACRTVAWFADVQALTGEAER